MMINIIVAASDLGVHIDGSCNGAKLIANNIKDKLNIDKIITVNACIINKGKINNGLKNFDEVNEFNNMLYNSILNINNNNINVCIGGDHSVSIASCLASKKNNSNIGLIWIDSHSDFHKIRTTTSKNIHGLPFSAITEQVEDNILSLFYDGIYYNPKKSVLFGARSIDNEEVPLLKKAGVTVITTEDIKKYGIEKMYDKALKIINEDNNGYHVSFDLDVIDPLIAMGVSIPEHNGLDIKEINGLCNILKEELHNIKSFDLVEYNSLTDIDNKTLDIAVNILVNIFK